jgi:hypothetical protein
VVDGRQLRYVPARFFRPDCPGKEPNRWNCHRVTAYRSTGSARTPAPPSGGEPSPRFCRRERPRLPTSSIFELNELGLPQSERVFRRSERTLFRLLSRDEDPALFFEHQKATKTNPDLAIWTRDMMRQATTAALAHAGLVEDPRVRGAAHKIATRMSQFLRSELAEKPIKRKASRNILEPEAYPPTVYSVAIMAYMPDLQRERAGFVERLGAYISQPETKRSYVIKVGRKIIQPTVHVLGDPLRAESNGNPKDLPFALHWIGRVESPEPEGAPQEQLSAGGFRIPARAGRKDPGAAQGGRNVPLGSHRQAGGLGPRVRLIPRGWGCAPQRTVPV